MWEKLLPKPWPDNSSRHRGQIVLPWEFTMRASANLAMSSSPDSLHVAKIAPLRLPPRGGRQLADALAGRAFQHRGAGGDGPCRGGAAAGAQLRGAAEAQIHNRAGKVIVRHMYRSLS